MFFKKQGLIRVGSIPNSWNKKLLNMIDESEWNYNTQRQNTFIQHKNTESILLRFKPSWVLDLESKNLYNGQPYFLHTYPYFSKYQFIVSEYLKFFSKIYNISDYGCMIVNLKPGGSIPHHIDCGTYFEKCSRIHIPIQTSRKVDFYFGRSKINMKVGKYYHIDNTKISHSVINRSGFNRIHIILDLFG